MKIDNPKPLVSVIMPTYNQAQFIGEAIRSVLNQTYENFELIIIDNYSSDDTEKVVSYYRRNDVKIRYTKFSNNGIIAASRNVGIKMAKGELIAFLDSDDTWLPEKLDKQVCFMEENKDVFLSYTKCFIKEDGRTIEISPKNPKKGYIFEDLFLSYNFISCLCVMMRREQYFFNEHEELRAAEDYDLWLSISRKEKISFLDEPLAVHVRHAKSSSDSDIQTLKKWKFIIDKYKSFIPKRKLLKKYISFYKKAFQIKMVNMIKNIKRNDR